MKKAGITIAVVFVGLALLWGAGWFVVPYVMNSTMTTYPVISPDGEYTAYIGFGKYVNRDKQFYHIDVSKPTESGTEKTLFEKRLSLDDLRPDIKNRLPDELVIWNGTVATFHVMPEPIAFDTATLDY